MRALIMLSVFVIAAALTIAISKYVQPDSAPWVLVGIGLATFGSLFLLTQRWEKRDRGLI